VVLLLAYDGGFSQQVPLAAVGAGAHVAFEGTVYETRRRGETLEIRATGDVLERVRRAFRRGTDRLVELVVRTMAGDHRVVGTPEHLFYVPERGFVPMGELVAGAALLGPDGEAAEVVAVEERDASSEVFNVEVEQTHTYFVCGGMDGGCELAHNACPPQAARDTASHAETNGGATRPGYVGNKPFANDGRGGGRVLPGTDSAGNPITYREYDTNPYTPGVNRGAERVVIGSDGSRYYTNDHYGTFTQF
jgi:hypothetical protein